MIRINSDYVYKSNNCNNYLYFNSCRAANLTFLSAFGEGVWVIGKESFILLKQKNIIKKFNIGFLEVEDEKLYDVRFMSYLIEKNGNIKGIIFEIPQIYNGGVIYQNMITQKIIDFYNFLKKKNIILYVDGARLLVSTIIHPEINKFLSIMDCISISSDKGFKKWSKGTFTLFFNTDIFEKVKLQQKNIGTYLRNNKLKFKTIKIYLKFMKHKIIINYLITNGCRKIFLKNGFYVSELDTNILVISHTNQEELWKMNDNLLKKRIILLKNKNCLVAYFNYTKSTLYFIILYLKLLTMKN